MSVLRVLWTIVRIPLKIVLGALLLPLLILQCMIEFVGNVVGIVTGFLGAVFVFIGIALMIEGLWDFISLMRIVSVTKKAGKAIKNFKDQVDAVDMK